MRHKLLGNPGLRVCELCLGTTAFGKDWGWGGATDIDDHRVERSGLPASVAPSSDELEAV